MKRLIILIVSIVVLLFLIAGLYIHSNHFKKILRHKIETVTNGKVIIQDKFHVSFYPFLSLTADKVICRNPQGFGHTLFAKFDKISFSIRFIPLLFGKISLSKIKAYDGEINILQRKNGKTNWQIMLEKIRKGNTTSRVIIMPKVIDIRGVNLNIINLNTRQKSTISNINFDIKAKPVAPGNTTNDYFIDNVTLNGQLNITAINVKNFKVRNLTAAFRQKRNHYLFSPLRASLYGGFFEGSTGAEVTEKKRNYFLKGTFSRINIQKLLIDLLKYDRLIGIGRVNIDLRANSIDPEKMMSTVNGAIKFNIQQGNILGVNFPSILNLGTTLLKTITIIPLIAQARERQTNFGQMSGSARIKNGILINRDLYILTKDIEITGEGKIDLVHKKINFLMQIKPRGGNIIVYANFDGPLGNPEIKLIKPSAVPLLLKSILPIPV